MTIDARHLRVFLAVAAEGNFTRAAAGLHVSQPALSRTLRQLEKHLGLTLIERSTHHVALTAEGEKYRPRAATAIAALDAALDPARAARPLRLGHAWSALGPHTGSLISRWQATYPDIPLVLRRIDDRLGGLSTGQSDVAVVKGAVKVLGVETLRLFAEERVVALPTTHPLAERKQLALTNLVDETIVINTVSGTTTLNLWPSSSRPSHSIEVTNTDDWLSAIASGSGVGISTSSTATNYNQTGVVYKPLTDAPAVDVFLAWTDPPGHHAVPYLISMAASILGPDHKVTT
ncbi:LysR family transcriptional regulator [Paenarthrobacter sp. NPDC058040]|uniref:LysR family transcriptional regulator n=1 Tax=unclassified Paenarthrobacter TaxID=2634190 RepID=UPI0036D9BBFD